MESDLEDSEESSNFEADSATIITITCIIEEQPPDKIKSSAKMVCANLPRVSLA